MSLTTGFRILDKDCDKSEELDKFKKLEDNSENQM